MPIDLKDLARRGAAARIADLEQEIAEIRDAFPETGGQPQGKTRGRRARSAAASREAPANADAGEQADSSQPSRGGRKKRTMSAEARARISAAQKARWAKQKRAK
jgi:hypothetical protein